MRLTASTIRTLALPEGSARQGFFDNDLPGFGLRVRATGVKTWMVQYAVAGKTRRLSLGSPDVLTAGKAREKAKDILAQVRLGRDPAREKSAAREKAHETFGAILPRFLERQRARLKPRSLPGNRAASISACQAAARPSNQESSIAGLLRVLLTGCREQRGGRKQPGSHVAVGVFHLVCARRLC